MLTKKEKKEMLKAAHDNKIRRSFQDAEEIYIKWLKDHSNNISLDGYITFLDSFQQITGPFPISKEIPSLPYDFRL